MSGPMYPNQQLRSVSLETHFRGKLGIPSNLGKVQERVGERLPNLFVPNVQPGEALALRPFQLRDEHGGRSLAIALNQVTYIAFEYPGYAEFRKEALEVIGGALELLEIEQLSRVTYRYENRIGIVRGEKRALPLASLVDVGFPKWLAGDATDSFEQLDITWKRHWEKGSISGRFHQEEDPGTVLRIELAATVEPAGGREGLAGFSDDAHAHARQLFESLITANFRDFLSWMPATQSSDQREEEER